MVAVAAAVCPSLALVAVSWLGKLERSSGGDRSGSPSPPPLVLPLLACNARRCSPLGPLAVIAGVVQALLAV